MPYDMMVASMRRFSADVMPRVRLGQGDVVNRTRTQPAIQSAR
jgi:hypothetical protein